ncbi:DUF899 domain-containing protein [Aspergillus tanneri]|uniref:Thioredoxin domain-containing protein n=1 Tax=Aspergillus tanneri TaxID=1220188 RepID=A0A5M9MBZ0_9EURO|nr:uncharacterized protein ATNIH1004_009546 [Aspergillus tanneri]KAA8642794.1 hypothetical protein ATNIH1004_009546 [Aspergillus tanneri]
MSAVQVVSPAEYRAARLSLLEKEKEATRALDALAAERRQLPIVEVTKSYSFSIICPKDGQRHDIGLSDLFFGRRQLIIYHFMFDPSWEAGCSGCTLMGDSFPPLEHLHSRSTSVVAVSRAPIEKIEKYKKRMGWTFPWVSSYGSDFNYDMHTTQDEAIRPVEYNYKAKDELPDFLTKGEQPGSSVFYRGDGKIGEVGKIYHTYSTYARGGEHLINTFGWLDMTPLGRQDGESGHPGLGFLRKDEYSQEELKGLH